MREYSEKDGGPAFPISVELIDRLGCSASMTDSGMTLRAYYAGQALASGLVKDSGYSERELQEWFGGRNNIRREEIAAKAAVRYADALIAELAK